MASHDLVISSLFSGTNEQHPNNRMTGQVHETTNNIRFDTAFGAARRNHTDFVSSLGLVGDGWFFVKFERKYVVCIKSSVIRVFDIETGIEQTVTSASGDFSYLDTALKGDFRTAEILNSLIILNRNVVTEVSTSDDYTVAGKVVIYEDLFETPTAQSIADGADDPTAAADGDIFRVVENSVNIRAAHYQLNVDNTDPGNVVRTWTETFPPNDENAIPNRATLPHRLILDITTGDFIFEEVEFDTRVSGNDLSNPSVEWFGSTLDAVAAHQGRLMMFGNSKITSCQKGFPGHSPFDLYRYNTDTILDSDRISSNQTDASLGSLLYAIPLGVDLVLIYNNGVAIYSTSSTARLSTNNGSDQTILKSAIQNIRPASDGLNIFFVDERNKIQWLTHNGQSISYNGATNDHRQKMLNRVNILDMELINSSLFVLTDDNVKILDRYTSNENLLQLAWGQMTFESPVYFLAEYNDKIRMAMNETTRYSLNNYTHHEATLFDDFQYEVCMDRVQLVQGVYIPSKNRTMFSITSKNANDNTVIVLTKNEDGTQANTAVNVIHYNNNMVYISGKYDTYQHYVGFVYESSLVLSEIYNGKTSNFLVFSRISPSFRNTTDFVLSITVEGEIIDEDVYTTMFQYDIGSELEPDTGVIRMPLIGNTRTDLVSIHSNSPGYFEINAINLGVRSRRKS